MRSGRQRRMRSHLRHPGASPPPCSKSFPPSPFIALRCTPTETAAAPLCRRAPPPLGPPLLPYCCIILASSTAPLPSSLSALHRACPACALACLDGSPPAHCLPFAQHCIFLSRPCNTPSAAGTACAAAPGQVGGSCACGHFPPRPSGGGWSRRVGACSAQLHDWSWCLGRLGDRLGAARDPQRRETLRAQGTMRRGFAAALLLLASLQGARGECGALDSERRSPVQGLVAPPWCPRANSKLPSRPCRRHDGNWMHGREPAGSWQGARLGPPSAAAATAACPAAARHGAASSTPPAVR